MILCLPKNQVDLILAKLKSGEINPDKLTDMGSDKRHAYFSSFLGEANAKVVNSLFESKLLLKNQQQGIINWAKQITGIKPSVRKDLITRVQGMTEILKPDNEAAFLGDLVDTRLGIGVTMEEAGKIADLAKVTADKKALIDENSPIRSNERLEYGTALTVFKDYVADLKLQSEKNAPANPLSYIEKGFDFVAGTMKSVLASMDNSFFGRQGLVTLIHQPDIWGQNFAKSWGDIGKELQGKDAMLPIKADVYSRPNAINGKYRDMGLDIGIGSEEAYPTSIIGKIPLIGRLYKASESAYNGAALRMRSDIADRVIEQAEALGVDVRSKDAHIGDMINFMTGRGKINLTPGQSRFMNVALFSGKFVKSQVDILTAPIKYAAGKKTGEGSYSRKEAALAAVKVIGTIAGVLAISKLLDPDSVEEDPRSSRFGKIWVGSNHDISVNISAGLGSLVTLASRITPTMHNGKIGFWSKNNKGRYVQLNAGKYGVSGPLDVLVDFMSGKASPISRILLDIWKGKNMQGQKVTPTGEATTAITPIPAQNVYQMMQSEADALQFSILTTLDLLGVNVNVNKRRKN